MGVQIQRAVARSAPVLATAVFLILVGHGAQAYPFFPGANDSPFYTEPGLPLCSVEGCYELTYLLNAQYVWTDPDTGTRYAHDAGEGEVTFLFESFADGAWVAMPGLSLDIDAELGFNLAPEMPIARLVAEVGVWNASVGVWDLGNYRVTGAPGGGLHSVGSLACVADPFLCELGGLAAPLPVNDVLELAEIQFAPGGVVPSFQAMALSPAGSPVASLGVPWELHITPTNGCRTYWYGFAIEYYSCEAVVPEPRAGWMTLVALSGLWLARRVATAC